MNVKELDLPAGVIEILEKEGITELYPPQAEAAPLAVAGKNLVVAVPTASGKSLIAYLAAMKHILERHGKVLYIVPLRALATEKYDDLRKFEPLGIKVGISVGDFDSPDSRLQSYDVIVATSEKADSLLRHQSDWLREVTLVVADEVHLINDPDRGPTLEVTLAKFKRFNTGLQIIALSATVNNSRELAEWLDAVHIANRWRPVKLKEGVYLDGTVRFIDNSTRKVVFEEDPVWSLVKDAIKEGGQALVFVNTRKSTESLAVKFSKLTKDLAEGVELDPETERMIDGEGEHTSVGRTLKSCVKKGIAFHNAGLTNDQRRMVEGSFKKGKIKCIVATPTLAAGINLPARRVVIRDVYRFDNGMNVPIPVMEIKQMCGRAGRPRYDPYGEAILLAKSEDELTFLRDTYLLGEPEDVISKLSNEAVMRSHVLSTIASGTASSWEGLMDFLGSTFFAHQANIVGIEEAANNILEFLEKEGMIKTGPDQTIKATFFGRRVSDLYIDPMSAVRMRQALEAYKPGKEFGLFHAVCSTPDMRTMFIRRNDKEWLEDLVMKREGELVFDPPEDDETEYEFFLAELKTATILEDWTMEIEEDKILDKLGIGPGDLRNKVEIGEWLLYSMREMANIFNKDAYPPLTELMTRLHYGVRPELLDLVKLKGVGRIRARSLFKKGFTTLEALRQADAGQISKVIGISDILAASIKKQVGAPTGAPMQIAENEAEAEPESPKKAKDRGQSSLLDF
ncbi:MAG TPA: DEAD/DEAH box helicase [Methanomassiliicoccales archaeon]|jgi:helicase